MSFNIQSVLATPEWDSFKDGCGSVITDALNRLPQNDPRRDNFTKAKDALNQVTDQDPQALEKFLRGWAATLGQDHIGDQLSPEVRAQLVNIGRQIDRDSTLPWAPKQDTTAMLPDGRVVTVTAISGGTANIKIETPGKPPQTGQIPKDQLRPHFYAGQRVKLSDGRIVTIDRFVGDKVKIKEFVDSAPLRPITDLTVPTRYEDPTLIDIAQWNAVNKPVMIDPNYKRLVDNAINALTSDPNERQALRDSLPLIAKAAEIAQLERDLTKYDSLLGASQEAQRQQARGERVTAITPDQQAELNALREKFKLGKNESKNTQTINDKKVGLARDKAGFLEKMKAQVLAGLQQQRDALPAAVNTASPQERSEEPKKKKEDSTQADSTSQQNETDSSPRVASVDKTHRQPADAAPSAPSDVAPVNSLEGLIRAAAAKKFPTSEDAQDQWVTTMSGLLGGLPSSDNVGVPADVARGLKAVLGAFSTNTRGLNTAIDGVRSWGDLKKNLTDPTVSHGLPPHVVDWVKRFIFLLPPEEEETACGVLCPGSPDVGGIPDSI